MGKSINTRSNKELLIKKAKNKKRRLKKLFDIDIDINNMNTKQLNNFVDRNNYRFVKNKYGVVFKKEDVDKLQKNINSINKIKTKKFNKIKNKNFKSRGKNTNHNINERRLMGDVRYDEFKPLKFNIDRFRTKNEFLNYNKKIKNRIDDKYYTKKDKIYKSNYVKALKNVYGKEANSIINKINKMTVDEFMILYYTEDIMSIEFSYSFLDTQLKLEVLKEYFI